WDLLRGAMTTKALALVADLHVAEALAGGPRPVDELARDVEADADALRRLLRALASDGVFAEIEPGVFGTTETSELLLQPSTQAFAHLFGDVFFRAIGDLHRAVCTGAPTFPEAFGEEFWDWLGARPEERASFDRAMAGGKKWKAERLSKVDWHAGETVVDIGGGNGALLREVLGPRPEIHGIVFDLPETDCDESALGDNIEFVAGSFFERVPAGDTYVLSAILHDWGDEHAREILRTIRVAARPDARLFVAETVIAPGNDPNGSKWLDLLMLVLAGGRERSEPEWRALLEGCGFELVAIEDGLIQARCP
ncbi:MAG TPA: methyltransferase, partial [Gaiellaceae bacterium]|nr:methyltransferase [Gaiellaceae bacterium]